MRILRGGRRRDQVAAIACATVVAYVIFSTLQPAQGTDLSNKIIWDSGFVPRGGFVPDEDTAVKLADVTLTRLFGGIESASWKPYSVELVENCWVVQGHKKNAATGGTVELRISKADGRISYVILGQ